MRLNSDEGAENKLMDIARDARLQMYTTSHSLSARKDKTGQDRTVVRRRGAMVGR